MVHNVFHFAAPVITTSLIVQSKKHLYYSFIIKTYQFVQVSHQAVPQSKLTREPGYITVKDQIWWESVYYTRKYLIVLFCILPIA